MAVLFEREAQLLRLAGEATRSAQGDGRSALILGPAGVGKTALLSETIERVRQNGPRVLTARGGELEADVPFGVVRQLFETSLRQSAPDRDTLMEGAAALSAPAFAASREATRPADAAGVLHGLYWLVANMAASGPVIVAVDDLQWADPPSQRFVLYLLRRLEGLPVFVLLAARSDAPADEFLARVLAQPDVSHVTLGPLSDHGVGQILEATLGRAPDEQFVLACRRATGGTPFLVHALAADVRERGLEPTAAFVRAVGEVAPESVGLATMLRLAGLHPGAPPLARAVAVLGGDADLPRAAQLAGLGEDSMMHALDALVAARILDAGPPLAFVHPILSAAVYSQIGPGERSRAHLRAADLLAAQGVAQDAVARHLASTEPSGHLDVIERLRAGAGAAQARGAPESAVAFLRRALDEGPDRLLRGALLTELGMAEKLVRYPACVEHLEQSLALLGEPSARARTALELSEALTWMGRWEDSMAVLDRGVADARDVEPSLALHLEAVWVSNATFDTELADQVDQRLPSLRRAVADPASPAQVPLVVANVDVMRGQDFAGAVDLVERALDGGRLLAREGPGATALTRALVTLSYADELDRLDRLLDAMEDTARADGSVFGFVVCAGFRVLLHARRGELAAADDALRRALDLVREHEMPLPTVFTLCCGAEALVERDGLADVAELFAGLDLPPARRRSITGAWSAELRGRLLLVRGERRRALLELEDCGDIITRLRMQPTVSCWRSILALALLPEDGGRARQLVESELADAQRTGLARPVGIALRSLGLIEGGTDGIERLRAAERVLRDSPARLEHARTLVELGAALRRANQRAQAREPLRAGLDLAVRCGADRLVSRASTELAASGARPRRRSVTGPDAMTPTERRIAELAAAGWSNPRIAQSLFVTTKTVENQLGRVYRKLGITGRQELGQALGI